jgi:hypothetical protein
MDEITGSAGVPRAKTFFDDVTIPGFLARWRELWEDTLRVLEALTGAGFMVGLKKCKFLVKQCVVLGYQVMAHGYRLACKFLRKWTSLQPPRSLKELQQLLGKLLWCSGFVPEFKQLMAPLEKLLAPSNDGKWTAECTEACNRLVQVIFGRITLHSADPTQPLMAYPSVQDNIGFLAITQLIAATEKPVAFLSRYMTKTEQSWGALEQQVALTSWGLRKARRYTSLAPHITVKVGDEAEVACIADREAHLRLRALLIDLSLYRVRWEAGDNPWQLGMEVAARDQLEPDDIISPPHMDHADIIIKRAH